MAIKRDLGISIGIFFIIIISVAIWSTWSGSPREIESAANQFKPDSSWRLVSSRIEPPRNMCLGDVACPSISQTWTSPRAVTQEEILEVLKQSGWQDVEAERGCKSDANYICTLRGSVGRFNATVYVNNDNSSYNSATISLNIE